MRWVLGCVAVTVTLASCIDTGDVGGSTVGVGSTGSAAASASASSAGSGSTAASTTGSGGASASSSAAAGGNSACADPGPGEPNELETTATKLAGSSDCDDVKSVQGAIKGAGDIDWYTYDQSEDEFGCSVDPTRDFSQSQGGAIRLCKFAECVDGEETEVDCPDDTLPVTSPGGRDGCCSATGFDIGVNCPGFDDVVRIYLRLDEPTAMADNCNQYNINYHF